MIEFNRDNFKDSESNTLVSFAISVYVILVGAGLPLFVRDKYFDILVAKYYYYCICTIAMFIIVIGSFVVQRNRKNHLSGKKILGNLSFTDYSILIFYLIALLSTVTSDYVYESFWGNEGRFTGLFLITWYIVSYFCVSKLWKVKTVHIDIILIAGILVCLFGITDYFKMDILGFKAPMVPEQRAIFTSTIGNINTYTAYVGIIVAISTVLFALNKEFKRSVYYYFCMVIGFFSIIMGVSDNAYLSLAALFSLLPFFMFHSKNGIRRYMVIITTFFTVVQIIGFLNEILEDRVLGINSAFNMVINLPGLPYMVIFLWGILIIWKVMDIKLHKEDKMYGNTIKNVWILVLGIVIISILYICYDINILGHSPKYGNISSYLVFNDDWGTHRGYIWRNAIERFSELSFFKKLIGFGPETFGIFILQRTANNPYNELFDNAHNEYLHLLITVGVGGLLFYVSFVIGIVKQGIKSYSDNPYIIGALFGVICYSVQAIVNLNLPIVTPVFWVLLGIGATKDLK